jgi:predicted enzyme related to lactoylglutathione lyase
MPKMENTRPNEFAWVELSTTDLDKAREFYPKIFGWTLSAMDSPDGPYVLAKLGDSNVAGLMTLPEPARKMGAPPNWLSYVGVEDAAASVEKVKALGGKVMHGPMDVGMGMLAVIQDPAGGVFALWQQKQSMGGYLYRETGACCWNELMTTNVDAAGKFYSQLFGWKSEAVQMEGGMVYTVFKSGEEQVGGMMQQPKEMAGMPSFWSVYFDVANTDETAAKVKANGGNVMQPPTDIPNIGRFAVFADPTGAAFAVLQAAKK